MLVRNERFVIDEAGRRVAALLDMTEYSRLLQDLQELESARAFDAARESGDEAVPFEQAVAEIERSR